MDPQCDSKCSLPGAPRVDTGEMLTDREDTTNIDPPAAGA